MNILIHLAEIMPQSRPFWEYSNPPPGMIAAGIFFMLLLCIGVAVDVGLVLHWIKRPVNWNELKNTLKDRAIPARLLLTVFSITIGFYLLASWLYLLLFPAGQLEGHTIVFQSLAFHFPVLFLIALLFRLSGIKGSAFFGLSRRKAPRRIGLGLLFYLAALPMLWFYSTVFQLFLQKLGYDFSLQDITTVLAASGPWPMRMVLFFIAIIVAPVFEEIIFRGILFPFLVQRLGFWSGIILVSLIFGGLHLHLPSFPPLFLLSVVFCLAYARTRSLLVPITMHAAFNSVTILILLLMDG